MIELTKKHPTGLGAVVVHEMTHRLERSHGKRLTKLVEEQLLVWRGCPDQFNGAPLAEEGWL